MSSSPRQTTDGRQSAYSFDRLGWLAFQEVVAMVLEANYGIPADAWEGDADRSRWTVSAPNPRLEALGLRGPVLVLVIWSPTAQQPSRKPGVSAVNRRLIHERMSLLASRTSDAGAPRSLLVVTDSATTPEFANQVASVVPRASGGAQRPLVVLDSHELSQALDGSAELRLRYPSVLGVRERDGLIQEAAAGASHFDLGAALDLAGVFVPTRAYRAALDTLGRRGFAVLTGPPEMGKTAIARMAGLAQLTAGWEVHECTRPENVLDAYRPEGSQVFIADDAFGSTEYRPDAADRWALDLERLLRCADQNHWLIWTSRSAPLRAALRRLHQERGAQQFPRPAEVQVDAAALDVEEKALILFRHAAAAELDPDSVRWIRGLGWELVSNPHFTPERMRRLVGEPLAGRSPDEVTASVSDPTPAMIASFGALADAHKLMLRAMLDVPPGPVAERDLAAAARRLSPAGLPLSPADLTDQLADHFLRVSGEGRVSWVHPSWRDVVIDELAAQPVERNAFLRACGIDGLLLALSAAGGSRGERVFPLLRLDADWDAIADRAAALGREVDDPSLRSLLVALADALDRTTRSNAADLSAVAESVLVVTRGRFEATGQLPSLETLHAWLWLNGWVEREPPDIGRYWADLMPVLPLDPTSAAEIERLDRWTQLVDMAERSFPDLHGWVHLNLRRGFMERIVEQFDDEHVLALVPDASRPALARALWVIGQRWGEMRRARELSRGLQVPTDVAQEFDVLNQPDVPDVELGRRLVHRVLLDLEPAGDQPNTLSALYGRRRRKRRG